MAILHGFPFHLWYSISPLYTRYSFIVKLNIQPSQLENYPSSPQHKLYIYMGRSLHTFPTHRDSILPHHGVCTAARGSFNTFSRQASQNNPSIGAWARLKTFFGRSSIGAWARLKKTISGRSSIGAWGRLKKTISGRSSIGAWGRLKTISGRSSIGAWGRAERRFGAVNPK